MNILWKEVIQMSLRRIFHKAWEQKSWEVRNESDLLWYGSLVLVIGLVMAFLFYAYQSQIPMWLFSMGIGAGLVLVVPGIRWIWMVISYIDCKDEYLKIIWRIRFVLEKVSGFLAFVSL
jgi:hypothetical protein